MFLRSFRSTRSPLSGGMGAFGIALLLTGCGPAPAPPKTQAPPLPPSARATPEVRVDTGQPLGGNQPRSAQGGSQRQRQMEFINRIRQADPQGKTIDKAVMNEQDELGLILDRSVQLDDVPKLLEAMLVQMAKEFPGEDLNVIAYTPSNPPLKVGTAHLDARTRKMSYTPARR